MRSTRTILGAILLASLLPASSHAQAQFSASNVYRSAAPAVVVIFGYDSAGSGSSGTGSIVTRDGKVLTNNHVIYDQNTHRPYANIRVFLKPDRVTGDSDQDLTNAYSVKILARDEKLDLAVLQVIDPPANLSVLPMGNSEVVDIGTSVAAIGHPGGGGLWTLTTGTVSSRRRDGDRAVFQTDTAINPGNSGGPLLDGNSHLIGVNTFVRRVNAQGMPLEGLNYSLRSSLARDWMATKGVRVAWAQPVHQEHTSAPQAAPAAPQPPQAAPPSHQPAQTARQSTPVRPRPQVSIEPDHGPAPSRGGNARRGASQPPKSEGPREFKGPDGETMYGIPNKGFSLDRTRQAVFQRAIDNASDAFDSLDAEFE